MRFALFLSIIAFFLILSYSANAENMQMSGTTPLNLSIYEIISADTAVIIANVTASNVTSANATVAASTSLDFVSNATLGNLTIVITRYTTPPIDTNLSSLNVVDLKYINISVNSTLNSSVSVWNLIKIFYTDSELDAAGVFEDSLAMYRYNTTSSQWIELTTSLGNVFNTGVNTTANYVWVNSTFFSLYAIGGLKENDQSCSVGAECYSNICCSGACKNSCPTTTTTPAGGGISIPTTPKKISNFTIDKDFMKVLLKPGETERKTIIISNTGNTNLTIDVNLRNLEDFLVFPGGVSEYTFDLRTGEKKSIQLNFFASEEQTLGIFSGKVVVGGDGIEKIITVVVEVESIKPLFDMDVEIPERYKEIFPGEDILVQLIIYNIQRTGRVDVEVEYGIKDGEGNVIASEYETLAVEMQVSIVRSLNVPYDIKPGNYVAFAVVKYDDTAGIGSDIFRVITREGIEIETKIILSLLAIIFALIIIIVILSLHQRKHKIYVYKRDNIEIIKDMKKRMRKEK